MSDYGLSRGSYKTVRDTAPSVDGKLFFILDYTVALADYSNIGVNDDANTYFVMDPEDWTPPEGRENEDWRHLTALRHGGMANVLFLDGHVESLPYDPSTAEGYREGRFLREDNTRWQYGEGL